MEEKVHLEKL